MKKFILNLVIVMFNCFACYSQVIISSTELTNEGIKQITSTGYDNILKLQNTNRGISNYLSTQQTGDLNISNINQKKDASSEMSNQAYTVQSGKLNELTIDQIGSGNLLLASQLGLTKTVAKQSGDPELKSYSTEGERNNIIIIQNGTNNGINATQQGSGNILSAQQNGKNNYLLALQNGTKNTISGYVQENISDQVLYDKIIQVGNNLSLESDVVSKSSINGNYFLQQGKNLAITINSELINSPGGMDIKQTGHDMKVVIDQSYFSFPLR